MHFSDRLYRRVGEVNSRLVIGVDPDPERIFKNDSLLTKAFPGRSVEDILNIFCQVAVEAAESTACAVKPQIAFFESLGSIGFSALGKCIRAAKDKNIPVILDAKRGDIGNTGKAYAKAYLDPKSQLFCDALTVNPYLGPDTLEPFVSMANKNGCGLFVLVKTSNPGSVEFQDAELCHGGPLYAKVAEKVSELGNGNLGDCGYSNIGAVCGVTYPHDLLSLRKLMPASILLLPGYGAQGGTAADTVNAFHPGGMGAVVSASRSIIFAYESLECASPKPDDIFTSVLEAAKKAKGDIQRAVDFKYPSI